GGGPSTIAAGSGPRVPPSWPRKKRPKATRARPPRRTAAKVLAIFKGVLRGRAPSEYHPARPSLTRAKVERRLEECLTQEASARRADGHWWRLHSGSGGSSLVRPQEHGSLPGSQWPSRALVRPEATPLVVHRPPGPADDLLATPTEERFRPQRAGDLHAEGPAGPGAVEGSRSRSFREGASDRGGHPGW